VDKLELSRPKEKALNLCIRLRQLANCGTDGAQVFWADRELLKVLSSFASLPMPR